MAIDLRELKKPKKIQTENIGARVDGVTKTDLERICEKENISVSSLVYKLVKDFIEDYDKAG